MDHHVTKISKDLCCAAKSVAFPRMIEATGNVSGAVTLRGATRRRAVIDVGTNSVKLLVADLAQGTVCPVWEESTQTRLGQGACESRVLSADAIARTARAVRCFVEKARSHGVALPKIAVIRSSKWTAGQKMVTNASQDAVLG